jgi:hypothetical protein
VLSKKSFLLLVLRSAKKRKDFSISDGGSRKNPYPKKYPSRFVFKIFDWNTACVLIAELTKSLLLISFTIPKNLKRTSNGRIPGSSPGGFFGCKISISVFDFVFLKNVKGTKAKRGRDKIFRE